MAYSDSDYHADLEKLKKEQNIPYEIITKEELEQNKVGGLRKMVEQTELVNYGEEQKNLEEAQNRPPFWNPQPGKYEVKILSEMSKYEFLDKKDGAVQKRAKLQVDVNNMNYVWSFGIGVTKASSYGQLVDYAITHGNKLTGTKITVVVKSDGKKRDFTIV